jgi:uncharacterized protein (TIGR00297 family)
MQIFLGLFLAIVIAILAFRLKALNRSGAWAAVLTGGLIFGLGGWGWATLLLAFFISSSLLSRLFARRKMNLSEKYSKGNQRDWGQVLANGGLGALLAIIHALAPDQIWSWITFAGAMASMNADTWSTELGVFNPTPPRLITSGKSVEHGTSGGVSLLGTLSALSGAALIALLSLLFPSGSLSGTTSQLILFVSITLGGLGGAAFDSLLGASVQAIYYCPACQKETERHPLHLCGTPTTQLRGWSWLNNDWVNWVASFIGALLTLGIWAILKYLSQLL